MVASGVASKGLDFSEIQHVINFTMPKEIEVCSNSAVTLWLERPQKRSKRLRIASDAHKWSKNLQDYTHQIGRTGRGDKTGIATTFINMQTPEQTLLDLKYLLMESKQKCVLLAFLLSTGGTSAETQGSFVSGR